MYHVLDLCTGIGGFSLTGKWLIGDWRTVCYVEIDKYCQKVIGQRIKDGYLDDAPIWDDLKTFDGRPWRGSVDIITCGRPCTPYSSAAHGKNKERDLWPEVKRVWEECGKPELYLENVIQASGSVDVFSRAVICSAASVGAPHIRRRLFTYTNKNGESRLSEHDETPRSKKSKKRVAFWDVPPKHLRISDGSTSRLDRTRALGNAIVPEVARTAWEILTEEGEVMQKYGYMANNEVNDGFVCQICEIKNPGFNWTDQHGEGMCNQCGTPYQIVQYDKEKNRIDAPPRINIREEWIPVLKEYWKEKKSYMGLGTIMIARDYPEAIEGRALFHTWVDENNKAPKLAVAEGK